MGDADPFGNVGEQRIQRVLRRLRLCPGSRVVGHVHGGNQYGRGLGRRRIQRDVGHIPPDRCTLLSVGNREGLRLLLLCSQQAGIDECEGGSNDLANKITLSA